MVSVENCVERMMLFISDNVPRPVSLSSPILSSFKGNVNNNKFTDASFYKFQLMHFKRDNKTHWICWYMVRYVFLLLLNEMHFISKRKVLKHKLVDWKVTNKKNISPLSPCCCQLLNLREVTLKIFCSYFFSPHCWAFLCMNKLSWVISLPPGLSQDNERLLAIV